MGVRRKKGRREISETSSVTVLVGLQGKSGLSVQISVDMLKTSACLARTMG